MGRVAGLGSGGGWMGAPGGFGADGNAVGRDEPVALRGAWGESGRGVVEESAMVQPNSLDGRDSGDMVCLDEAGREYRIGTATDGLDGVGNSDVVFGVGLAATRGGDR